MRKSRLLESQSVEILKGCEAGIGPSKLSMRHGISRATDVNWLSK
jgi:hypothetical protein